MNRHQSSRNAMRAITSGNRIFVQGCAATPSILLDALAERRDLTDIELIHIHTEGKLNFISPFNPTWRIANLFVGNNIRHSLDYDRIDYLPCFLSEIPQLFRSGKRPIDVALVQVSSPDPNGMCSLGTSVDVARAAVDVANVVIAQINPRMPRCFGDGMISIDQIDHAFESSSELPESLPSALGETEKRIGQNVSALVDDGATLQLGIGAIPDAVAKSLKGHRNLGIHTEMWSDGTLDLIECGAVDNSLKKIHPGKTVSSFVFGSRRLYDFIDGNPDILMLDAAFVNSLHTIAQNPKVVAINSAVEVDLTGQVCADSVGYDIISGVGGQMDFVRGASLSEGGKPIIALTSRTKKGSPRIVPVLKEGAGVVTTRGHVHYVVTEYGAVDLYGKTLRERAKLLIKIAHPDDREWLDREWFSHHRKTF